MSENFEKYNLEEAQDEADEMKSLVGEEGAKEDYDVAHEQIEKENYEKAKQRVKSDLLIWLNEMGNWRTRMRYDGRHFLSARLLQQKFNIIEGDVENDPEIQQKVKETLLSTLESVDMPNDLKIFEEIKLNFFVSDDIYNQTEFQEAAKKAIKSRFLAQLQRFADWGHFSNRLETVPLLQQKFGIPDKELEAGSEIQRAVTEDAKRIIISRIEGYIKSKSSNPQYHYLEEALDIKRKFGVDDQLFAEISHIVLLNNLESGDVNNIVEIQKIFSISNEKLLSPEYTTLAKQSLDANFERGNKDSMEKIREIFLLDLDMSKFVKNKYLSCINGGKLDLIVKLKSHFSECEPIFQEFLKEQEEAAKNSELPFSEKRKALDNLAGLAEAGEVGVIQEFSEILKNRAGQKEIIESKRGFDNIQEAAFYILMKLDTPESNQTLFSLISNENVNSTIKKDVFEKLLQDDNSFFNSEWLKGTLREWLYSVPREQIDWRDLEFIGEIQKIPSKDLKDQSLGSLSVMKDFDNSENSLYETWNKNNGNIPKNVFLQVMKLNKICESEGLLDKFQNLFTSIRKESSKKENLLYSITYALETDEEILKLLGKKLMEIDFGSKKDAETLSDLLRRVIFLNKIENIKNYRHYDEDYDDEDNYNENYEEQPQEKKVSPEILEIFSKEVSSLEELVTLIREFSTKKFQEILPNENITSEKIEAIEKEWGDLEPIFTYLGRYPKLKNYIAEIAANIDSEENWKNYRYNLKRKGAKEQIGHLSSEQLEIWKGDYFSEIGDIMVAETGSDKPSQIQNILKDAVLQHKHIFNPEMGQDKNEFIQKFIENAFNEIERTPDKQTEIINNAIKNIFLEAKNVDAIIGFYNLPRVRQSIESILPSGAEIAPSSKIKNTIDFISGYLPDGLREKLTENYSKLETQKKLASDELFTNEMREAIEQRAKEIEINYQSLINSDIWEKLHLDKNNLNNLEQFYQKRQELKSAVDLLRLSDLSNKLIATNRIVEKEGKKGGETITNVLEKLKKYFKGSPLFQDINNVEFILKEKIDFGEKRRLAMIFTDNAQMLWQAGKYPLGNGSCQHYAEGDYANNLMGYVGDPNCKAAYLVDLNKLPQSVLNEVEEKGFEEVKNKILKQELLNASIARSIIKITKDNKNKPAVLLEPTYTVVNKGDAGMDKYFNLFVDLMVAEPMKARMARGGGSDSVTKGRSLSPEGQYEDLDLNKIKFINKLSEPTQEEIEIIERIRSSR